MAHLPDHFMQAHEGNQDGLGMLVLAGATFPAGDLHLKSGQDLADSVRLGLFDPDPGEFSSNLIDGADKGGPACVQDWILAGTEGKGRGINQAGYRSEYLGECEARVLAALGQRLFHALRSAPI